jgi:hypothetical protein
MKHKGGGKISIDKPVHIMNNKILLRIWSSHENVEKSFNGQ